MSEIMTYEEACRFYDETKSYGSVLGLANIRELTRLLGDVWRDLNIVHVAGTNGKGSVCAFLASVLHEAGYRTGQFHSPAVFGRREVFLADGQEISKEEYAFCMARVADACKDMTKRGLAHPTPFEVETALAFYWFYQKNCDIVILETGMGGSLDATNVIERPLCSVITPIGMDHMEYLGGSLAEIAAAKAGIIKQGCPVISAMQLKEAEVVLKARAKEKNAPYGAAPQIGECRIEDGRLCYVHPWLGRLRLRMAGSYQAQNSALAVRTLELLRERGFFCSDAQIRAGIENARWAGRFERVSKSPPFYMDGAHNAEAAEQLKMSLLALNPRSRRIGVMGVMADKPYGKMLGILLPLFEKIYTVTPDNRRALPAEILAEEIRRRGGQAIAEPDISSAVRHAYEAAKQTEGLMAVAFGSLYYLREVKNTLYELSFITGGIWH